MQRNFGFDIITNAKGFKMRTMMLTIFFVVGAYLLGQIHNANYERYKIYMHPTYRADQYLLDTKTGQILHLVKDDSKDNILIWEPMITLKTYEDYMRYNSSEETDKNEQNK